ncbi:gag-pol polyprotein [Cucumis melo var. makuwa]|uniref:Gag-pol polyprotein n=1 Tax=Cucumis melo var. makuwa TaxID=1194695 RepID=A0A5A7UKP7_CUCMM|nr:gag-pol polyprotein [Cucumis melo var. makuwa]TYK29054.1 gag-pol polyprotein [Cucumis melo var. makuwa]
MDGIRERNLTTRPPLLDGGNYRYWKALMVAFLMSLDMRCWRAIISGWEHPTKTDEAGKMKLDELFGSLRTFELHLEEGESKRKTGIAQTFVKEEVIKESKVFANEDSLAESIVLLTKYHECKGFGHIQIECPTYLKRKKKSLVVALSDDEDYSESDEEEVGRALISISTIKEGTMENANNQVLDQQGSISNKPLNESTLKRKWEEDQLTIAHQQDRIQCLMEENHSFLSSIATLKAELKEARN